MSYPAISGTDGGGNQIVLDYQIQVAPTIILIAPDHEIVIQSIWPFPDAQAIIDELIVYDIAQHDCSYPLLADFEANNTDPCIWDLVQFTNTSSGVIDSFNWTFEGGIPATSNEENPLVTYENAGVYDVSLTTSSGLEESTITMEDLITVHNCTGIEKLQEVSLEITPNPNDGIFKITLPENSYFEIQLLDMMGNQVFKKVSAENNQMDLSDLKKGIYVLKAQNETFELIEKVIIR